MKIHRELFVECELNDLSKLAAAIEAHLPTGWKRNRSAERKLGESYLCFACLIPRRITKRRGVDLV